MSIVVPAPEERLNPRPAVLTLSPADVADLADCLEEYTGHFAPLFKRAEQRVWAKWYLRGLLTAEVPRKNIEAMALHLLGAGPDADRHVRALQQFLSAGGWDDDRLLAEHQRLVEATLGEADGVLTVDGSDVPKQGRHSVGVARQWCGATGKQDNCQAGVFLGYASRQGYTLLDRRLYLPACWFSEPYQERWQTCRVPTDTTFQTKPALAATMVETLRQAGRVRARWLVCDEAFGQDPAFLDRVAETNLHYLAEVPRDTLVWPLVEPADGQTPRARPVCWVPPPKPAGKGPVPTVERLHPASPPKVRLDDLARHLPPTSWQRYRILEGAKGPLVADFACVRAIAVRDRLPGPEVWVVLRRPVEAPTDESKWKHYLSNAPSDTPLATLVRVSGLRWPIESCFTEAKSELGLDHYEVRSWRGWHHHMTLVLLAHGFLVQQQQRLSPREGAPSAASRTSGRCAQPAGHDGPAARDRGWGQDAGAGEPATPQPGRDAPAGARGVAATGLRRAGRLGAAGLSAAAQMGRLSLAPAASAPPPR